MDSMPWPNTSGMPALLAKSLSICSRTWSFEAPAKSASVPRPMGPWTWSGRRSPTLSPAAFRMVMVMALSSPVPDHGDDPHLGAELAALIGGGGVLDDELQRPALLVEDVGGAGDQGHLVAGIDGPMVGEDLLAVQDALH